MCSYASVLVVALCAALVGGSATADEAVSIELDEFQGRRVIVVRGVADAFAESSDQDLRPAALAKLLAVYAGEEPVKDQPAVLGAVKLEDERLIFQPRYPFKPGMAYRVMLSLPGGDAKSEEAETAGVIERVVRLEEEPAGEPTSVKAVYPSGDTLPENLLKFYVHFSAPMAQGDVYSYVRLLDEEGQEVDYPFVQLGQELWDRSGTRITLLLDPGRIKRGLRPREELGPILYEGRKYELVIDGSWRDARGRPLAATFRKPFRAAAPDDEQPDPAKWRVEAPAAGTVTPLAIKFAEPLDHAMLGSSFAVFDERDREVAGTIQVGAEETLWQFVPRTEWTASDYHVKVDAALEDRAGNSIEKPFEVDVFERVQAKVPVKQVVVPFRVRGKSP